MDFNELELKQDTTCRMIGHTVEGVLVYETYKFPSIYGGDHDLWATFSFRICTRCAADLLTTDNLRSSESVAMQREAAFEACERFRYMQAYRRKAFWRNVIDSAIMLAILSLTLSTIVLVSLRDAA